jgi:hypothetical protein
MWARNGREIYPKNAQLPRSIQGSFTCRKSTTWDPRLYFASEGRRADDFFFALKYPTASVEFEPRDLGPKGQRSTSRPTKSLAPPLVTHKTFRLPVIMDQNINSSVLQCLGGSVLSKVSLKM